MAFDGVFFDSAPWLGSTGVGLDIGKYLEYTN
jgi:hypothetical protein